MEQELEKLTMDFGYGKLPLQNHLLLPTRFHDAVESALIVSHHDCLRNGDDILL